MTRHLGLTSCAALMMAAAPAFAQSPDAARRYEIAAGPMDRALAAFAQQSGQQILYTAALTAGRRSPGLSGDYTAEAALARLLADTGLGFRRTRPNVYVVFDRSGRADLEGSEPAILEEVVVTGSLLRGADSPSPVTIITQADIERRGRSTVADVLASLPQNFTGAAYEGSAGNGADRSSRNAQYATGVNLRGLGADATLVLVNGRRIAGTGLAGDFADVSNLPTAAVERVDVLLDGASALYGADAVGGVVNIILRRDFEGYETRLRYGGTSDGGAEEVLASQVAGFNWSGGNAVLSYEYHDRGELEAADRRATANADLRPLGGSDWRDFYAAPGNLMFYDPATGGYSTIFAIPTAQDGTGLTPGDFRPGETNLSNQHEGRWTLPHQTRHSVFAAMSQDLGGLRLDADLRFTQREFDLRTFADIAILGVTPDNPYFVSPDGEPFQEIAYSFINDLGPGVDSGRSRSYGGSVGLEGDWAGWGLSAYLSGAQEANNRVSRNRAQQTYLAEALGAVPDNPATPFNTAVDGFFNPYGDPAVHSAAVLDFIGQGYSTSRTLSTVSSANLKADRTLMELPGGPLRIALGVDYRSEAFKTRAVNFFYGAAPQGGTPRTYERDVASAFVELRAPLVGPDNARPGLERLELSVAGRTEHHEGIGSTATPKVGVLYAPFSDLLLRASYGQSFRAPSLRELYSAYQLGPTILSDGTADVIAIIQYGGNPDLRPETADSVTAGFVWTPAAFDRLRVEGTWFRTAFKDRISQPVSENILSALTDPSLAAFVRRVNPASNADDLAFVESLLANPGNYLPGVFPATAYGVVIDTRYVNAAEVRVEGIDLSARLGFDAWGGSGLIDATVTRLLDNERKVTPSASFDDLLGDPNFPARWRGRAGAEWSRDAFTVGLTANYVSGGRDPIGGRGIDDWTTFDGQVRYEVSEGLALTLTVRNIANAEPPFFDAPQGIGYDAANTDVLGRQIAFQLVRRW